MNRKKLLAVLLLPAIAISLVSYVLLPEFFGEEPKKAEKPAATPKVAALPTLPAKPTEIQKEEAHDAKREILPVSPSVEAGTGKVVQTPHEGDPQLAGMVRERQRILVKSEYEKAQRAQLRQKIVDETDMEKALLDSDKARFEREEFKRNPTTAASKAPGLPGMPPVTPFTGAPSKGMVDFDKPMLKMVSVVGQERYAYIELHNQVYRVKQGEKVEAYSVKTVSDDAVELASGKQILRLTFALPSAPEAARATPLPAPGTGSPAGRL